MHKQKIAFIFEVLKASGVSVTDFSRLTGISRETIYRWRTAEAVRMRLLFDIAYMTAVRLQKATLLKRLPLQDLLTKEARLVALRNLVAEMATK